MTLGSSMGIISGALSAQSERLKIHANNIANLNTPNYKRKIPVLMENNSVDFDTMISSLRSGSIIRTGLTFHTGGVQMAGMVEDPTPGKKIHMPGHPEADEEGYVVSSTANPLVDMSDATMTQRLYEANLAVMGIIKQMANKALEIGRGG